LLQELMLRLTMDTLPGDDSVLLSLLLTLRLVSRGVHDRALCLRRLRELLDLRERKLWGSRSATDQMKEERFGSLIEMLTNREEEVFARSLA
jgi:hypothetical protein